MSDGVLKYQVLGVITKMFTTLIGIAQAFIVVRILTPAEYGFIGLALAVSGIADVVQNLGINVSMTREIALNKDARAIPKIFYSTLGLRLIVSFVVALLLFFFSDAIAVGIYEKPELAILLRMLSLGVFAQGLSGLASAAVSSLRRFKVLFFVQAIFAAVNFVLFASLTYKFRMVGYFAAVIVSFTLSFIVMIIIFLKSIDDFRIFPTKAEIKKVWKDILSLGMFMALLRLAYIFWEKAAILFLGVYYINDLDLIGQYNFAMNFSSKFLLLTTAIVAVNVPVFSAHYAKGEKFLIAKFKENFDKLYYFLYVIFAVSMIFFSDLTHFAFHGKFDDSLVIFPYLYTAYFFVAITSQIIASGIILPVKKVHYLINQRIAIKIATVALVYILIDSGYGVIGAAAGTLLGIILSTLKSLAVIYKELKCKIVTKNIIAFSGCLLPMIIFGLIVESFTQKLVVAILSLIVYLILGINFKIIMWDSRSD